MRRRNLKIMLLNAGLVLSMAAFVVSGPIGLAHAAKVYRTSQAYTARLNTEDIGISILEDGKAVSSGSGTGRLFEGLFGSDGTVPCMPYRTSLTVRNTADVDSYVRVTIRRYWTDVSGDPRTDLDPSLVELTFGKGWEEDVSSRTAERIVLYCREPVNSKKESSPFVTGVQLLDGVCASHMDAGGNTVFDYDGTRFVVDVAADAVQTHSGEEAVRSTWGKQVKISGGVLSVK